MLVEKKNKKDGLRILGVDPGYERLGLAVVEKKQGEKERVIYSECFRTDKKLPHSVRLVNIGVRVREIIEKFKPDCLSIEKLFFNTNQKTALLVSEARGIILYEAAREGVLIEEFNPSQIKIAVAGDGHADKAQVIKMVTLLVKTKLSGKQDDEYDAVAAALTSLAHKKNLG
jgi:crossover junction endodeoxyribonuclease RuvC